MTVNELPINKQFSCRLVRPNTWLINCYSESGESPKPHVVIGEKHALIIDTTDTRLNLRAYIEQYITDKPLMVASTHSHGDHTLANAQFNDCPIYMSQQAWVEIQEMRARGLDEKKPLTTPLVTMSPPLSRKVTSSTWAAGRWKPSRLTAVTAAAASLTSTESTRFSLPATNWKWARF